MIVSSINGVGKAGYPLIKKRNWDPYIIHNNQLKMYF